ncbi:hypothetical protein N9986_02150 [Akkermansiaceae bacterium]|nr:hypothetical protein [Akkermansiaceae bacterium]
MRPYLLGGAGECHRLYCPGDNPFENESIRALHRCYCEVQGQLDGEKNLVRLINEYFQILGSSALNVSTEEL